MWFVGKLVKIKVLLDESLVLQMLSQFCNFIISLQLKGPEGLFIIALLVVIAVCWLQQ